MDKIKKYKFDYIFITIKLKDVKKNLLKKILQHADKDTAIIPPCTELPYWWFQNILRKKKYVNTKIYIQQIQK